MVLRSVELCLLGRCEEIEGLRLLLSCARPAVASAPREEKPTVVELGDDGRASAARVAATGEQGCSGGQEVLAAAWCLTDSGTVGGSGVPRGHSASTGAAASP